MGKLSKETLGLFGEYAVASELCKRGVYAQLTLGHYKGVDLLVVDGNKIQRIQVKAKQGLEWPHVQGITNEDEFLVLVDIRDKDINERPDFYIMTHTQWRVLIKNEKTRMSKFEEEDKREYAKIIDNGNNIEYQGGKGPIRGLTVKVAMVNHLKDRWEDIVPI